MDVALVEKLKLYGTIIFDWTEDWAGYYQNKYFRHQQKRAIQTAHKVITVTEELAKRAKQICRGKKEVLFLPNASAWRAPGDSIGTKDKTDIINPRIGFAGHLGPWIDIDLVEQLAKAEPEWNWVFAGTASKIAKVRLKVYQNIHLLGPKPFLELPRLMAQCQVLVAPYRKDFSGDASKLYDYLTLKLPIVSADIETARRLGACVKIATGLESWIRAIREGLPGNGRNQTFNLDTIAEHTWTKRSEVLSRWLSHIDP